MLSSIAACTSHHVDDYENNILVPILLCGTDMHEILTSVRANRIALSGVIVECRNTLKKEDAKEKSEIQYCDMDLGNHIYRLIFSDNKLFSYQKLNRKSMVMYDVVNLCQVEE
jgi:hypothetical protein